MLFPISSEMVVCRKPSRSPESQRKGSTESTDSKNSDCKLVYRKGVLISQSSNHSDEFKNVKKIKRSNSFFNFSSICHKQTNLNSDECSPVSYLRRHTCAEAGRIPSQDEPFIQLKELMKRNCKSESEIFKQFGDSKETLCGSEDQDDNDLSENSDPDTMSLNKSDKTKQLTNSRRDAKDFIPSFVLVDACKEANERKIRELGKRLCCISSAELDHVVNFQDPTGRTPLSYACGSGNVLIIEELSKLRGLNPNLACNESNSPLHYAAQAGHSEAVDLMLSRFEGVVNPNCRNSTGLTPLMKAALQGRTRCAKSLIIAGASPYLQDYSRGLTAIEWARLCGRHICAEVIIRCVKDNQKHGSPPSPITPSYFNNNTRNPIPTSQSAMELKRINSDDSPYYNLYQARSTVSGATWLKNKIRKALGASVTNPSAMTKTSLSNGMPSRSDGYALMSNLSGATICASSLLLPSIKPLLDQQQYQKPKSKKKLAIPTLQVTPVNKR